MNGLTLNGWKPLDFYTVTRSRIDSRLTSPLNTLVRKGSIHRQSCHFVTKNTPAALQAHAADTTASRCVLAGSTSERAHTAAMLYGE